MSKHKPGSARRKARLTVVRRASRARKRAKDRATEERERLVVIPSCGCVFCDIGLPPDEGKHIVKDGNGKVITVKCEAP